MYILTDGSAVLMSKYEPCKMTPLPLPLFCKSFEANILCEDYSF